MERKRKKNVQKPPDGSLHIRPPPGVTIVYHSGGIQLTPHAKGGCASHLPCAQVVQQV